MRVDGLEAGPAAERPVPERARRPATQGRNPPGPAGTPGQRVRASLVAGASWLACRLPEGMLIGAAEAAGEAWYRLAPTRAAQARRNLGRVCAWADEHDLGSPAVRAAASDPRALERLVRSAFRHHARYYVEVARAPVVDGRYVRERMLIETPDTVRAAFDGPRPAIFVGLHFGAIELPAVILVEHGGTEAVAPMETIGDPALQRWFVRTRGRVGIRIVGLREARRELLAALRAGTPVGLVADRDLTGGGIEVPFFGAPAPLPAGPALLVDESGSPAFLVSVRRAGRGRYRGRLDPLPAPVGETRRARITAFLHAEAAAFERAIVAAPDQWWACFFPVWPDLASDVAAGLPANPGRTGAAA